MSSTDNRIVKMVFDYAEFKKGAAETKKSLAEVDAAVAGAGKGKGLLDLQGHMGKVAVSASKMAVVVTTALATIVNKAVNAGMNMASALTLDPLKSGFSEYESLLTKQNVIMNATGKSGKVVKGVLNELNDYSDKTIYSFGNMTDAITKFVNAGVPLKKSVTSIRGIANAAAFAGASSEEANRAMYAFSQSMSLGFIGLQDWMQIENANMGTVQFKNELLKAAVAAGTLTKKGDEYITKSGKAITATKGWRDGLQEQWATTEVLNKALGKYADTNTKLGKKAFESATQVRTFSAFMDTLKESLGSGWAQVFTNLIGGLDEATNFWTGLSNTVGHSTEKFFGWINATVKVFKGMGGFGQVLTGIQNILAPFGAILDVIGAAWRTAFPSSGDGSGETLFKMAKGFATITAPLQKVGDLIRKATPVVTAFFEGIREGSGVIGTLLMGLSKLADKLLDIQAPDGGGFLSGLIDGFKDKAGDLISGGVEIAKNIFQGVMEGFANIDFDASGSVIAAGLLGAIFLAIRKIAKGGIGIDFGGGLFEGVKDSFDALTGTLSAMQAQIQSKTLMQIAIAIGLITASVVALSLVDTGKLTKALSALSVGFGQLLGAMAILVKISGAAGFVKVPLIAAAMVLMAGAIFILVGAIALMGQLKWETIGKGLAGIAGALVAISVGMRLMPKSLPITAAGLVLVGLALNAIAGAIAVMGNLEWETIGKGLATVAGALVAIAVGMSLMPLTLPITAAGLILVGIALNEIALALKVMGGASWEEIGKGMATLGGSMAILAIGLTAMSGTLLGSAALMVAATAIGVLTPALLLMSHLSWEEIAKGMVALAGGLTILGLAMYAMTGAVLGAAALLIVAPAILALSTALVALSALSWEDLLVSLAALAGGLTIIGLAGLLLTPVIPTLIGLGVALLLLGAGLALAGVGILAFSTGLGLLVSIGGAAFALLSDAVAAFIDILPDLAEGFAEFIVEMITVLAEQTPAIANAFVKLMIGLINAANRLLPKLPPLLNNAIDVMIKVVLRNAPKLASAGLTLIIKLLDALEQKMPALTKKGADVVIAFIKGIGEQGVRLAQAAYDTIITFINKLADTIRSEQPRLNAAMMNLADAMIDGLANGIKQFGGKAIDAMKNLGGKLIDGAKSVLKVFSPSRVFRDIGKFVVQGLTLGIQNNASAAIRATAAMVGGQIAVASEYINKFIQDLDQRAIAAEAKANGLALAADRLAKNAKKTKDKKDDKRAAAVGRSAEKADREAEAKEKKAEAAKAAAERAEKFREASTLDKAKMRSEDAEKALDRAKASEKRAEAARVAAAALEAQIRKGGLTKAQQADLNKQAAELRKQAREEAARANAALAQARKAASDALTYQKKAGEEAALEFQKEFDAQAKEDADAAAFEKLSSTEKAEKRRKDAAALQLQAQKDLADAKKLAFTDLEAANALAKKAMDEAELARQYLKDAEGFANQTAAGVSTANGSVVNLEASEAAALAFNDYSNLVDAAKVAAGSGTSVEFNQYNTSPESLSATEIYRQTNNQLTFALDKLDEVA